MIEDKFGHVRKSSKGETISECTRQFMAFSMDGTNHSIARFDELKKDPGHAAVLERNISSLLSTASMKRFFSKFNGTTYASYRSLLNELFIWRLKQDKPEMVFGCQLLITLLHNMEVPYGLGVRLTKKLRYILLLTPHEWI